MKETAALETRRADCPYLVRPRAPLSWLDPGVFGTLGVGGGFAAGAALCRPSKEVWLLYGDGSSAYSLAGDARRRRRDGAAPQRLSPGGRGLRRRRPAPRRPAKIDGTLDEAKAIAREGRPVCINVHLARSDFRKGSISM